MQWRRGTVGVRQKRLVSFNKEVQKKRERDGSIAPPLTFDSDRKKKCV